MEYFIMIIFFLIGLFISISGLCQIIISLLFAIPFTIFLKGYDAINNWKGIIKKSMVTIIIWTVIFVFIVLMIIMNFGRINIISFFVGFIVAGFNCLKPSTWGMNPNNVQDYVRVNKEHFNNKLFAEALISDELIKVWIENSHSKQHPMHATIIELFEKYNNQKI